MATEVPGFIEENAANSEALTAVAVLGTFLGLFIFGGLFWLFAKICRHSATIAHSATTDIEASAPPLELEYHPEPSIMSVD